MAGREDGVERRKERKVTDGRNNRNEGEKKRVTSSEGDLGVAHERTYRRRHTSRSGRIPKWKNSAKHFSSKITDDDGKVGVYFVDDIHVDDYDSSCNRYDDEDVEGRSGLSLTKKKDLLAKVRQKDRFILRIQRKYVELERHDREVKEECKRLNRLLEKHKEAYHRMCSRYHKLTTLFQEIERTKIDLLTCNQKLKTEEARRSEDVMLLKSVVYRLNFELERCQDKLKEYERVPKPVFLRDSENLVGLSSNGTNTADRKVERAWGCVDFHVLGPLLSAYDINLVEKSRLIARYEQEMAYVGSRCKEIVRENERMHAEVEDLRSKCDRYVKETSVLAENVLSLKRENDSLAKESEERQRELRDVHRSYERKIGTIVDRNETLQKQHVASFTELNNLRERYSELSKELETLKSPKVEFVPLTVHVAAIDECKKLFEELKLQYETERRRLLDCIKRMEKLPTENANEQLTTLRAERNHFEALVNILEKNLKRVQRKSEYTRRIMYSAQISRESMKKRLRKFVAYCEELFSEYERVVAEREKLAELLRETERENADYDRIGKSIASRVSSLKEQLRLVQSNAKRQTVTIENQMKAHEFRVDRMKRKYRGKVCRLRRLIKQKESIIGKLRRETYAGNRQDLFVESAEEKRVISGSEEEKHELEPSSPE